MGDAGGFHARLRACVVQSGMVVKELSDKAGISKRTIDGWLAVKDPTTPKVDDAVAIARVLGVSVEWLVTGKGPEIIPSRLQDILEDLRVLSPDRLAHVVPCYDEGEARAVDNFLKKHRAGK